MGRRRGDGGQAGLWRWNVEGCSIEAAVCFTLVVCEASGAGIRPGEVGGGGGVWRMGGVLHTLETDYIFP